MKEVSYIKTQWFNLLIGFINLGVSISYALREDYVWFVAWLTVALTWLILSKVDYNNDCIELLEKKQERDDAMFELVQELLEANKIDREIMRKYEARLKKLEENNK